MILLRKILRALWRASLATTAVCSAAALVLALGYAVYTIASVVGTFAAMVLAVFLVLLAIYVVDELGHG